MPQGLVRGMEDLLRRSLGPQVRIETRFPLRLPKVEADANQLELALLNLAVNSRDAMPEGGTITIDARERTSTGWCEVGLTPGEYVCLALNNTGEGMGEPTLRRARDPFFTTKPVGKGTGLGLSMVHGFAAQSRGTFVLRSCQGAGTTAEIWLPVAQTAETEEPKQPQPEAAPARTTSAVILAVDDDALVLMNTVAMLEDLPPRRPRPAAWSPAITRSRINARSYCASAPRRSRTRAPPGVRRCPCAP